MENQQQMIQVKTKRNILFSLKKKTQFFLDDKINETGDNSNNFSVEYARSNRSTCHQCNNKIEKDLVRLSRKVSSSHSYIPTDQWYHIDCFKEQKDQLHFHGTAETFVVLIFLFCFYLKFFVDFWVLMILIKKIKRN